MNTIFWAEHVGKGILVWTALENTICFIEKCMTNYNVLGNMMSSGNKRMNSI